MVPRPCWVYETTQQQGRHSHFRSLCSRLLHLGRHEHDEACAIMKAKFPISGPERSLGSRSIKTHRLYPPVFVYAESARFVATHYLYRYAVRLVNFLLTKRTAATQS